MQDWLNGRITFYGDRVITLLKLFERMDVKVDDAQKKDCEAVLAEILAYDYKGESKRAFALVLLEIGIRLTVIVWQESLHMHAFFLIHFKD